MANAAKLKTNLPVRALVVGYPKAGKTGSLACLANAGFKLRILDFDGNLEPLLLFTEPDKLKNIDIVSLEDTYHQTESYQEPKGIPDAFYRGVKLMDHWRYKEEDGTQVDLGSSKDWGLDTIVVMDGLTANGDASLARALKLSNKTTETKTDAVYNVAIEEQTKFIKRLGASSNTHHTLVLSHLKMVGPKDYRKGESDIAKQIKRETAEILHTRLWPSALGHQWPQFIGGEFPTIVQVKQVQRAGRIKRFITATSTDVLDLGIPALNLPSELDIKDGMLQIFGALSPASIALVKQQQEKTHG